MRQDEVGALTSHEGIARLEEVKCLPGPQFAEFFFTNMVADAGVFMKTLAAEKDPGKNTERPKFISTSPSYFSTLPTAIFHIEALPDASLEASSFSKPCNRRPLQKYGQSNVKAENDFNRLRQQESINQT